VLHFSIVSLLDIQYKTPRKAQLHSLIFFFKNLHRIYKLTIPLLADNIFSCLQPKNPYRKRFWHW